MLGLLNTSKLSILQYLKGKYQDGAWLVHHGDDGAVVISSENIRSKQAVTGLLLGAESSETGAAASANFQVNQLLY